MKNKVLVLAATELRLLLRNKTVAFTSIGTPLALGVFWVFTIGDASQEPLLAGVVVALQLAVVLGMGVYVASTLTVVARRDAKVLKRLRTSDISDTGLLVATVAPAVAVGILQLVIFAVVNLGAGIPLPVDPLPLVLALLGGLALCVLAALATAVVTPSPERAQITTLPLTFVLLGAGIALVVIPAQGWWRALVAVPGAAIGDLTRLAYTGGAWEAGVGGVPAVLPALVALVAWPVIFAALTRNRFRWDPRY